MKNLPSLALTFLSLLSCLTLFSAPTILPEGPGGVFLEGNELKFALTDCPAGERYQVVDWQGNTVTEGEFPEAGKALTLPELERGYYLLTAEGIRRDFCVVATPEAHGAVDGKLLARPNTMLGIDTAQSWLANKGLWDCPWYDGDSYRLVNDLVYWCGIPQIRERLSWHDAMRKKETVGPDFQRYFDNAQTLRSHGIKISGMYHDAADWAKRNPKLPRDMVAAYTFAKIMAEQFGDCMADWEFWNEEDIGFASEPVWDYAAAMKASALGFKAGNKEVLVGNGAIALGPYATPYPNKLFDNEIGKYLDFYNYHTYDDISTYGNIYDGIRKFLSRHNLFGLPIWCTESGMRQEGEAKVPTNHPQYKAHSPEQEMLQAEFYPKSQIAHWFNGCTKNFWFVFCPLNEAQGVKDWGLMRRDGSVKPGYCAISTMTLYLADATLQGRLNTPKGIQAYLFDLPDGTQTLCYWSESGLDTKADGKPVELTAPLKRDFQMKLPKGAYKTADWAGTRGELVVDRSMAELTATRYPSYITGLKGMIAEILPIPQGARQAYDPAEDEDLSVILRVELNSEDFRIENVKTNAVMNGKTGRLTVEIWNLEDKPKTGNLLVDGAILQGLPETISLPPMGKAEFPVTLIPAGNNGIAPTDLILTGCFDEKYSTRLMMPYICETLAQWREFPLNSNRPEAWTGNTSADIQTVAWDDAEQAVRFDVRWTNEMVDRWFYPFYVLDLPKESMADAVYLQFEVKMAQDKIENDVSCAYVMLQEKSNQEHLFSHNLEYPAPIQNWETRRIRLQTENINPEKILQFKVGCNPRGRQMTYWIRNIKLLKAE